MGRGLSIGIAVAAVTCSVGAWAQNTKQMQLSAAARECRPHEVADLVAEGVDLNATNSGGYTPLMMAASYGCEEAVRLLLENGADVSIKHPSFGDAAAQAKMNRYYKLEAMIQGHASGTSAQSAPKQQASRTPKIPEPAMPVANVGAPGWPELGNYKVGQDVLFSGTAGKTWDHGVIKSIDPIYGYNIDGWTGSYDPYFVVGAEREPFWTSYFVGDWKVSVPIGMGTVTDGRYVYRTVTGGIRLPPLRIKADGTYSWRVQQGKGEKLIRGKWEPNPKGPGVILKAAEQGTDWLVYNNSRTRSQLGETVILSSECCTHYDGTRLK